MRGSPPKGKEAGCNRVKRRRCQELKGRAGRKEEEEGGIGGGVVVHFNNRD